jgi:hypothetical protein
VPDARGAHARAAKCRAALDEMAAAYRARRPDVAIILGKDQKEIFTDMSPSIAIYSGEEVHNGPPQRSVYAPDHHVTHKCHPGTGDLPARPSSARTST